MRIRYFFPHPMQDEFERVLMGRAPTDRLYGLIELRQAGHDVRFSDSQFHGGFSAVRRRLRPLTHLVDLDGVRGLSDEDVVVVKDEFSTMLTAACRARGTKIIYLDAIFQLPTRIWRKAAASINLIAADGHIAYSREQISTWSSRYRLPEGRLTFLPYCIDMPFYQPLERRGNSPPYVLAVGRDPGRSFGTLITAMQGLGIQLKLVTLPYTLRGIDTTCSWIEVLQHVSYEELFRLYAEALLVSIPLKAGITYPAGIRGLLEALSLGKAVVASRSSALVEYVPEGAGVVYVEPERPADLRRAIEELHASEARRIHLETAGPAFVRDRYDMPVFCNAFERFLSDIVAR